MSGDSDSTVDWEERLERLLLDWFDVPVIDDAGGGEPRCLRVLRRAVETTKVFGFQNELLPRQSAASEVIDVIAENQGVWTIGYLADGTDQPDAVVYGYNVDEFYALLDWGLPQLVYQSAFIEAVFSHPSVSIGSHIDAEAASEVLGPHLVASELTDGENYSLPATYDLGDVLVMGFGTEWFFAGAHDLAVLQQSRTLAAIGSWL